MRLLRGTLSGRAGVALLASLALVLAPAPAARGQFLEPKVVGGSATTIEQYPWQAAVVYDPAKVGGNPFQRQFCGGSLVTPYIVLTAAHCVYDTDPQNNSSLDPDDVNVVLGRTTLSTAPPASEFDVQGVAYQAGYDPGYGPGQGVPSNDVGYLVLASPYNATTPIDIAGSGEGALWDPGSSEEITGWGATAESGAGSGGSDSLRVANVPIVTDASCATSYGTYFNSSTMVCAGYPEGEIDTCYGDSGGPMQAPLGGGAYRLVGITSWGSGCARPNAPGVYTRVAGASLRPAVASKVFELETEFGLPHENVVGGDDTQPPAPPTITDTDPDSPSNQNDLKVKGSAEAGSTVRLYKAPTAADCTPGNLLDTDGAPVFSSPGLDASASSDTTVRFRATATDAAGNVSGCSEGVDYVEDSTAPSDPTLSSPSHEIGVASNDPTVAISFSGASDGLSGVDGFSYQWSTSPTTLPDTLKDAEQTATGTTSPALANGNSHYFHLRTRDNAGNWSSTVHLGPFVIDVPEGSSPSPAPTPPAPTPLQPAFTPPPDSAPPDGRLSAQLRQELGGGIVLEAGCDEDCSAVAGGLVIAKAAGKRKPAAASGTRKQKFKLTTAGAEIAAGGSATLKLKPKGKKARRGLRKLVKAGARAKAKINVTFTDRAANSAVQRLIVKLQG